MIAWILALLLLSTARGAELEQVRIFVGEGDARVLLVADGALPAPRVRSTPPVGEAPARAVLLFDGTGLSAELERAYVRDAGSWSIPVDRGGLRRVVLARLGGALQVSAELDRARGVETTPLDSSAVLVGLRLPGAAPDPSLPGPEFLADWLAGVPPARGRPELGPEQRLIVLDPGHGGWDQGATGVSGTHEASLALGLCRLIAHELERRMGARVVLTREDDTYLPLRRRAEIANSLGADLFISIHGNAAPSPALWGIETYSLDIASDRGAARVAERENSARGPDQPVDRIVTDLAFTGTNRLSRLLAEKVQQTATRRLREVYGEQAIRDLGAKSALFTVLASARMPAILYEAGFLTAADEEMRLRQPICQRTTAAAIAEAVQAWFQAVDQGGGS